MEPDSTATGLMPKMPGISSGFLYELMITATFNKITGIRITQSTILMAVKIRPVFFFVSLIIPYHLSVYPCSCNSICTITLYWIKCKFNWRFSGENDRILLSPDQVFLPRRSIEEFGRAVFAQEKRKKSI